MKALRKMNRRRPRCRGSALLVVLWSLIVLSAGIFAYARWIQANVRINGFASQTMEARAMAHSGVAVAMHPRVDKQSALLEQSFAEDLGFRVRIISEGGKLSLKWIVRGLVPNRNPVIEAVFKLWLEQKGLNFQQREAFVDCLIDYVDDDGSLHQLNGSEDDGDYHPANKMLESIDELAAVKNSGPLMESINWKNELTLDAEGPIDLLSAPPEILRLLPGLGEARIQRLITLRQGPDKLEGTADDPDFAAPNPNAPKNQAPQGTSRDPTYLLQNLGIDLKSSQLQGLVTINDPVKRIISQGRSGKVIRQVEVVILKGSNNPPILSWKE